MYATLEPACTSSTGSRSGAVAKSGSSVAWPKVNGAEAGDAAEVVDEGLLRPVGRRDSEPLLVDAPL